MYRNVYNCGGAYYSKIQSYNTAREVDVAAFEAKLITQEEYYRRHPEDKPAIPIKKKKY